MSRNNGGSSSPMETLIYSVLPNLSKLPDTQRQERVDELLEFSDEILSSRLPSSLPLGSSALPDIVRRSLSPEDVARFNSLWATLQRGRTLSVPHRHLQFLLALSNAANKETPTASSSRPRSAYGTPARPGPSTRNVLAEGGPPAEHGEAYIRPKLHHLDLNSPQRPSSPAPTHVSKAELLRQWRTHRGRQTFPESLLLRDALYLLQGIDGRYVRFALAPSDTPPQQHGQNGTRFDRSDTTIVAAEDDEQIMGIDIVVNEPTEGYVFQPVRSVLVQLSEMGVLYRKIIGFIKKHQAAGPSAKSGMVIQSLCHFLHHELSEYHRLLAVLESQLSNPVESQPAEASELTLLRLGLWTEDMKLKLRLMETVVDDASVSHGGALVSKIHSRTKHGDPFARNFTNQILEEVSKPFFHTLQRWILSGELHDPFNEFFVQINPDIAFDDPSPYAAGDAGFEQGFDMGGGVSDSHHIWEKKYVFVKGMAPGFINEDFGKKIFSTGRSLNFIRYNCFDTEWTGTRAGLAAGTALKYSDLIGLERSIDDAYSSASKRLLEIFYDKYKLFDHLRALKAYLMLGAGDFAELLMEALAPRLSKPAISLYRHHLTSDLESAIRGSNAQFDSPDVLRRLDARVLEYSHGELGWDCFALEYKVEAPLNAVLDARSMAAYDRLFQHLWHLKRVETALAQGWMRVTSASRAFESLLSLDNDWHHCRIIQAEMVHFLRQLQAFCQLEVIECSWQTLLESTSKRDGDLDSLIAAHRTYLDRVVRKILLTGPRGRDDHLLNVVREALSNILSFRNATEDLYGWSLGEATRLDRQRDAERGISTGTSTTGEAEVKASAIQLEGIRERIQQCTAGFQDSVTTLCKEAGGHSDLDVRFLAIRIAFNGHYALRRGSSRAKK